jgi:hypothetical protein
MPQHHITSFLCLFTFIFSIGACGFHCTSCNKVHLLQSSSHVVHFSSSGSHRHVVDTTVQRSTVDGQHKAGVHIYCTSTFTSSAHLQHRTPRLLACKPSYHNTAARTADNSAAQPARRPSGHNRTKFPSVVPNPLKTGPPYPCSGPRVGQFPESPRRMRTDEPIRDLQYIREHTQPWERPHWPSDVRSRSQTHEQDYSRQALRS